MVVRVVSCGTRFLLVIMSANVAPEGLQTDRRRRYISAFTSVAGRLPEAPHVVCGRSDVRFMGIVGF